MMVQGRVGGSGERFNFGEITVTRCALRIGDIEENSPLGISYVMGRNHRQAQLAAMADALLQNFSLHADLESNLLKPIRQILQEKYLQKRFWCILRNIVNYPLLIHLQIAYRLRQLGSIRTVQLLRLLIL